MSSFKHKYAVAEAIAWANAVNRYIPDEALRVKIAELAATNVEKLANGESLDGAYLDQMRDFGEIFEEIDVNANAKKQGYPNA